MTPKFEEHLDLVEKALDELQEQRSKATREVHNYARRLDQIRETNGNGHTALKPHREVGDGDDADSRILSPDERSDERHDRDYRESRIEGDGARLEVLGVCHSGVGIKIAVPESPEKSGFCGCVGLGCENSHGPTPCIFPRFRDSGDDAGTYNHPGVSAKSARYRQPGIAWFRFLFTVVFIVVILMALGGYLRVLAVE